MHEMYIVKTLFLELKSNKQSITFGCIYRHPNGNAGHFNEAINSYLNEMKSSDFI